MTRSWRNSAVTAVALFLEGCALYLVIVAGSTLVQLPQAYLPFWLVLLAVLWAFLTSSYLLTMKVTPHIRGLIGVMLAIPSLLILANLNTGAGVVPVSAITSGEVAATAGLAFTLVFLVLIWWRAGSVAQEEVTLESVREAFMWALIALFIAVLVDQINADPLIHGYFVVGFFGVGLAGLSLARFSSEAGENQVMSVNWFVPIVVCVALVLVLGLLISALGLGGLDDLTRAVLRALGTAGFWIIRPILLAVGFLAGLLVAAGNWVSGMFGGGDLSGLIEAQARLEEFHEGLVEEAEGGGSPDALFAALRWSGVALAAFVATFVLYRLFRARRFLRTARDVEETRESLFSWKKTNDDLSAFLSGWWANLTRAIGAGRKRQLVPVTPREFYHGLLGLAEMVGRPRKDWETPKEHQRNLSGLLPADPVARIVDRFQSFHYGRSDLGPQDAERLTSDWLALNEFVRLRQETL